MPRGITISRVEDACVHHLIAAQAARTPEAIAVVDGDTRLSYRQLLGHARRLARLLGASGVQVESRIGVCCARSADMIVAVLAVLEAGAAYVPLDPDHPAARLEAIAGDAGLELVITQRGLLDQLAGVASRLICVDDPAAQGSLSEAPLAVAMHADHAMYALYTSGSTGEPKGVVTAHRAITSRLLWAQETYPYQPGEVACARTTLGFVDSVAEIFAPLAFGVPLVIIGGEAQRDLAAMVAVLAAARVTRIVMVPSLLSTLLELEPQLDRRLPALRYWFLGGEPVPVTLVERFGRLVPGRKLINIYGATELSGDATYYDFDRMPPGMINAPIGTPVRGVHARVVDGSLAEVADGEVGEVCVSGVCLARGYLGRPEQTAARFVDNPFPEGGKLYRTHDLGRRMPTGDLEYLGRVDQQVKIRGMRVELPAVESLLADCPGVAQAVAVAQADAQGRHTLVAFYTRARGGCAAPAELRAQLASRVPDYMVPAHLIELEAFPINANGKVDRRALRERRSDGAAGRGFEAPAPGDEQQIAALWQQILECGPVGRDHRFLDLGGNSLAAARIVAILRQRYSIELPIRTLFETPTVAGLAAEIARRRGPMHPASAPAPVLEASGRPVPPELALSHYQVPFWLFRALTGGVSRVGEVFGFSAPVEIEALQQAFSHTVGCFDALWMRFPRWRPVQRLAPRQPCRFVVRDHRSSLEPAPALLQRETDATHALPFDLERPPLIHARLVLLPDGDQRLVVSIPHVVVDMSAMELFRRTLQQAYRARLAGQTPATPATAVTLADLVAAERQGARLEADRRYWATVATGPAWVSLPRRLFTHKLAGRSVRALARRPVAPALESALGAYGRPRAVSLPNLLTAALHASISRISASDDVTLLLMLEKRDREAVRSLFTNLASVMRFRVAGGGSLDQLVERTARQLMASYEHSDSLMHSPVLFNDFWAGAPRTVRALIRAGCAALARAWPGAGPGGAVLAGWLFALLPYPGHLLRERRSGSARDILVCLNIMPEVYERPAEDDGPILVFRQRQVEHILVPGDLMVDTDALLDRTLQVHVARAPDHSLAINLYGGGLDQAGLDEIGDHMLEVLEQLAGGRSAAMVPPR